jgi:ankyrin repeat protein
MPASKPKYVNPDDEIINTINELTRNILDKNPKQYTVQREKLILEILENERFKSYLKEDIASIVMREVVSDKNYTPLLRWLVKEQQANINHIDSHGRTILVNAVAREYKKSLINSMLTLGADIYKKGPLHVSPLLFAYYKSEEEFKNHTYNQAIYQLLLAHAKSIAIERETQQSRFINDKQYESSYLGKIKAQIGFFTKIHDQPQHYWKRLNDSGYSGRGPGDSKFNCAEIGRIVNKNDLSANQKKYKILAVLENLVDSTGMLNHDGLYEDRYCYPIDLTHFKTSQKVLNKSKGLAINIPGENGWSALMYVVEKIQPDSFELLDWLIQEQKADINLGNTKYESPLMLACSRPDDSEKLVKRLIKLGADINSHTHFDYVDHNYGRSHQNQSALGCAIRRGNLGAI